MNRREQAKMQGRDSGPRPLTIGNRRKAILGRHAVVWLGIAALLALLSALGAACNDRAESLAAAIHSAPAPVREAYAYAVAHPEVLQYIPCYCGCEAAGHSSNEDCFVDQRLPDGRVVYDSMGLA